MNDRPKSIRDLAYMANREDIPNIQYSLRKLIKAGFVTRIGSGRAGVTYEVTPLGLDTTDRYADVRATLLIDAIKRVPELAQQLEDTTRTLELMIGIYAQAARAAATHRWRPFEPVKPEALRQRRHQDKRVRPRGRRSFGAAMRHRPKPAPTAHGLCGLCRQRSPASGVFCRNRICFSAGVAPIVRLSRWGGIGKRRRPVFASDRALNYSTGA